jgi:hypothetical protein
MSFQDIKNIMTARVWPDHAQSMHAELAKALRLNGYYVWMEYPTRDLGDLRDGRIDLYVTWAGGSAGIELDGRKPRKRSIDKLRLIDGYKIVGVRGIERVHCPQGIDAVVTMRVRAATEFEKADRRTVNRDAA